MASGIFSTLGEARLRSQEFLANGTFTWPAGVDAVWLTLVGGGMGGGRGDGSSISAGGGGGGEVIYRKLIPRGTATTSAVTIGAGGTAGVTVGAVGGNGGNSTFVVGSTTYTALGAITTGLGHQPGQVGGGTQVGTSQASGGWGGAPTTPATSPTPERGRTRPDGIGGGAGGCGGDGSNVASRGGDCLGRGGAGSGSGGGGGGGSYGDGGAGGSVGVNGTAAAANSGGGGGGSGWGAASGGAGGSGRCIVEWIG